MKRLIATLLLLCLALTSVAFAGDSEDTPKGNWRKTTKITVKKLSANKWEITAKKVSGAGGYEFRWARNKEHFKTRSRLVKKDKEGYKLSKSGKIVLKDFPAGTWYVVALPYKTKSEYKDRGKYRRSDIKTIKFGGEDISNYQMIIGNPNVYTMYIYNGELQTPEVTIKKSALVTLKKDRDYTLSWYNNVNAGTATVVAKGIGKYTGTRQGTFVIGMAGLTDQNFGIKDSYTYTGEAIYPDFITRFNDMPLVSDRDFTVTYVDNVKVGTAQIRWYGKGNFCGMVVKPFSILPVKMDACSVTLPRGDVYGYSGNAVEPEVEVKYKGKVMSPDNYTLSYSNNTEMGTATVTVHGNGNLEGDRQLTFQIKQIMHWPFKGNWRHGKNVFANYYPDEKNRPDRPYHTGIDMVGIDDIRVFPFMEGTIKAAYRSGSNGCHVVIEHNLNGRIFYSLYAHMRDDDVFANTTSNLVEKQVGPDTQIGVMGNTGASTGDHLHFGIFTGYSADPWGYASSGDSNITLKYEHLTFYNPQYVLENGNLP